MNSHCLSHEHMHQTCCFVNTKCSSHSLWKKSRETFQHIQLDMYRNSCAFAFISQIKSLLWAAHSTYVRPCQQPSPALLHWVEAPKCLDSSISEISSSEEKARSEVAEPQQSQSCFCKLQYAPAMSNNSRYVYRKDTFRLISWEISLNTFSLLHHAEQHQSSWEIYYIFLEK